MNNQIVLANPIATAVKPKPTKKEVIDALVQLKIQELIANNKVVEDRQAKLKKKLDVAARRFVTRNQSKTRCEVSVWEYGTCNRIEVEFKINDATPEIKKMADEFVALKKERVYIDEKRVKRQIMEGMNLIQNSSDRVATLLSEPASRKALEAILKEIE